MIFTNNIIYLFYYNYIVIYKVLEEHRRRWEKTARSHTKSDIENGKSNQFKNLSIMGVNV